MLIKSRNLNDNLEDLEENFIMMKNNKVKINPAKYAFGVMARKFHGFMSIEKRIEIKLAKCKAILEIRSPTTIKEVQRLNSQIVTLSQFMSKSVEKCLPLYKILKKDKSFRWNEEYEKAFIHLKEYLSSLLILTRPNDGEIFFHLMKRWKQ